MLILLIFDPPSTKNWSLADFPNLWQFPLTSSDIRGISQRNRPDWNPNFYLSKRYEWPVNSFGPTNFLFAPMCSKTSCLRRYCWAGSAHIGIYYTVKMSVICWLLVWFPVQIINPPKRYCQHCKKENDFYMKFFYPALFAIFTDFRIILFFPYLASLYKLR